MRDKYPTIVVKDLVDVRDGTHDSPTYVESGFPLVTSKNLVEGNLDLTDTRFITKKDYDQINMRSKVDVGDVLYSMIGSIGNRCLVKEDPQFAIKNVALFKFNDERLYNKYFYYLLGSYIVNRQIEREQRGGTQKFVSLTILRNLEIPLPTLSEQKAIVAKLNRAQRLIDIDQEMLAKYDELIQSVFLEMFGDPAINPLKWTREPIRKLISKLKVKREDPKNSNKIYDYVSISDVDNDLKRITDFTPVDNSDAPSRARQLLQTNDILVSTVRPNLNAVAIYKGGLSNPIASTGFCILRPNVDKINPFYLFQISQSNFFVSELRLIANGASYPAVSDQDILNLEVPIPPIDKQNKFQSFIERISKDYISTKEMQKKSEELFSSLVQGIFG